MNVVQFLEQLGAAPHGSVTATYASAVDALGLEAATRNALLSRDPKALNRLLGGRGDVRCFIVVPD